MKKTLIAGASIVLAGCLLTACGGGEGGSPVTKVEKKPPSAEKVPPPDAVMQDGLKANSTAPAGAPASKKTE